MINGKESKLKPVRDAKFVEIPCHSLSKLSDIPIPAVDHWHLLIAIERIGHTTSSSSQIGNGQNVPLPITGGGGPGSVQEP
jgi:hypothetical protein